MDDHTLGALTVGAVTLLVVLVIGIAIYVVGWIISRIPDAALRLYDEVDEVMHREAKS